MEFMTIGFIGGGNMSTAIAKGILNSGQHPASKMWVSGPQIESLKHWKEFGANVTIRNGECYCKCDILFLGVKPALLTKAVKDCVSTLIETAEEKNVLFISMLAGVTLDQLHEKLSVLTKKPRVIRIMPNTPMTVGAGACLYTPDDSVKHEECVMLEKLLCGSSIYSRVPESMMDSLGSLVGCGPAYVYLIIEGLADGAVKQGVPRDLALRFAAQAVIGGGRMVLDSGKHPGQLKDEVCSPGGSTICGVSVLENGGVRAAFINAIEASTLRTKELGK